MEMFQLESCLSSSLGNFDLRGLVLQSGIVRYKTFGEEDVLL